MTPSSARCAFLSLLLGLAVPASAGPQDWEKFWLRQEWMGLGGSTSSGLLKLGEFGIYEARHGLGVGTSVFQMRAGAWDIPRRDGQDVSAHAMFSYFSLNAFATLHSWHGTKKVYFGKGKQSIGRLELFGSYSPLVRMGVLNRETRDIINQRERTPVAGDVKAEMYDIGLRLDLGSMAAFSVGRMKVNTADEGLFRPKSFEKTYAAVDFYFDFGITEGREAGGGIRYIVQDAWYWLSWPFHRRGIVKPY